MTRKFTEKEKDEIMDWYCEPHCLSYLEIADKFSTDRKTIARIISKTFMHKDTKGEHNGNHVLSETEVKEMREIYFATDLSYRHIADIYRVSKNTAMRAIKGISWSWLE